ncbi:MAG: S8 family serine peptidase [Chloroflexota bacterium]
MTRRSRLHPFAAAVLVTLTAASGAFAAEPTSAPAAEASTPAAGAERVIVVLKPDADPDAAAARARGHGARVERTFRSAIRAYAATATPAQARRLAADPSVAAVVPDERIAGEDVLAAQTVPTGVSRVFGRKSAAARIDGIDDRVDADVAIYDTGIDPTHTDLAVAGGYNCTSSNRADWIDGQGHGTHVAGTVGALDNGQGVVGVAPGVRLWAVRILDEKGEGYLSWWLCGLDWIAAQKDPVDPARPLIEAVNMSVTRWGTDDGKCGTVNADLLHQAICRVVARGITVVVAAANDAGPASKRVPAAYNEVITVSALADTDGKPGGTGGNRCWSWGTYDVDDTFADFSNYGGDVDLIAPGKCIWSTKRGETYGYSSGTSMAAPHVAGAVALYRASRPEATPAEVRWALQYLGNRDWQTATDPDGKPDILLDVSRIGPLGDFAPSATLPAEGLVTNEVGATWTVPLAAGRGPGFIEPITFSVAAAPAPLAAALIGPITLSGTAAAASLSLAVPPATPAGTYDVVVKAAYHATRVHEVHIAVVVENEPPVATAPVATLVRGSRATLTGVPLRLSWAPALDQSPIASYQLGEVTASGPRVVASTAGTVRSAVRTIPFATARAWAVRATDRPGNVGPWAAAAPVRVSVVQESSTAVRRGAGWTSYASTYALGGRAIYATRAGSIVRYTFTGRGIALVGAKGPTRGTAEIRLDGVLVGRVSAWSKSSGSRWLLQALAVSRARSHTLEVRVLGTAGHPRFDVDAFLVLR